MSSDTSNQELGVAMAQIKAAEQDMSQPDRLKAQRLAARQELLSRVCGALGAILLIAWIVLLLGKSEAAPYVLAGSIVLGAGFALMQIRSAHSLRKKRELDLLALAAERDKTDIGTEAKDA